MSGLVQPLISRLIYDHVRHPVRRPGSPQLHGQLESDGRAVRLVVHIGRPHQSSGDDPGRATGHDLLRQVHRGAGEAAGRDVADPGRLAHDGFGQASVFGLLASIIDDRTWERLCDNADQPFASFTAFVEGAEPGGLGTSRAELVKLLALRHPHEDGAEWRERAPWLRTAVAALLAGDVPAASEHGAVGNGRGSATPSTHKRDAEEITARLKRDDPDLAARVVAGEVSPNAAAREKGWRKPRVVLTSPASVAIRLRQHFTPDQVAELRRLLTDGPS